ncbi:aldo/keto reductase [Peteryoungia desertarenae]|uniref:Aldo/keto reductase n=1 Tax=Peteryoungia desertarenae TaxID=1813451 RepID=A0ABX6QLB1_9HYPH|nr:aldo/keto reductase [Peteryoungia desertarenae]QLF69121.1 aldo/keto reductase [Peteryoungia desertarenae]
MQKRSLGRTGFTIAPVVFGGNVFGWTADQATSFDLLDRFFDAGYDTIDTADVYSSWVEGHVGGESETIIGQWLKRGSVPRERVTIVSKVGFDTQGRKTGLSAKWILEAVDASLKRLGTDHIDLYLAHKPDEDTPIEETLQAFERLKREGKIRAIGCSNYDATQLQHSLAAAKHAGLPRFDVLQPEYNLYTRNRFEGEIRDLCMGEDIGVISYYALAAGFLTGKYRKLEDTVGSSRAYRVGSYLDEKGQRILAALDQIAAETRTSPATVAIAWVAARPGITAPIASATSLGQLDSLIAAGQLELTKSQMDLLTEAGE